MLSSILCTESHIDEGGVLAGNLYDLAPSIYQQGTKPFVTLPKLLL